MEDKKGTPFSVRLGNVIESAYKKTGKAVVVLVDRIRLSHSTPTVTWLCRGELRGIMRDFFSPLKGMGQYLRFLFITGISKFKQMSIFSELNNLQNISMRDDFSAICGTPEEALAQIDSKQYAVPYQADGRRVVKVGVNFDSATRTIGEWIVR